MNKLYSTFILIMVCVFSISAVKTGESRAKTQYEYCKFDVFDINLLGYQKYYDESLQKTISSVMYRKFGVKVKGYQDSFCVDVGKSVYVLTWECGEMHGCDLFLLAVNKSNKCKIFSGISLSDPDIVQLSCSSLSKYGEEPKNIAEACNKKGVSKPIDQFYPISKKYPKIRLGKTSRKELIKIFGTPTYTDEKKIVYATDRNKEIEKGCGYPTEKGLFSGRTLTFFFDTKSHLIGIWADDGGGEC